MYWTVQIRIHNEYAQPIPICILIPCVLAEFVDIRQSHGLGEGDWCCHQIVVLRKLGRFGKLTLDIFRVSIFYCVSLKQNCGFTMLDKDFLSCDLAPKIQGTRGSMV